MGHYSDIDVCRQEIGLALIESFEIEVVRVKDATPELTIVTVKVLGKQIEQGSGLNEQLATADLLNKIQSVKDGL